MNRKALTVGVAGVLVLASCGGGGSDEAAFDVDRACRIAQRLVDETAAGDRDGVVSQVERLADVEGVEGQIDVDEIDDLASDLDENAVEDLISEFEAIGCTLELPSAEPDPEPVPATTAAPAPTTTAATPLDTEPTPSTTSPPTTLPPATTTAEVPPTSTPEVAPIPPAGGGGVGTPVDVGSTGPGVEFGLNAAPETVIADWSLDGLFYSPNTNVIDLQVSRDDFSFGGDAEWSASDVVTMSASTAQSLEQIRASYRSAIEATGIAYEFTESQSVSEGVTTLAVEAEPVDFRLDIPRWDIRAASNEAVPGVVLIEVGRRVSKPGALPAIPAPAVELLGPTADMVTGLGWTVSSYRFTDGVNQFSGNRFISGGVGWDISEDDTREASVAALKAAQGGPFDSEESDEESSTWVLDTDDRPFFSIRYSEILGTTGSASL